MSSAARTLPTRDDDDCLDAVLAREARYRDIVENANDLIVAGDLEERIVSVNTAFEHALGYSREELIGRPLASLVTPEWRVQLQDAAAAKLSGRSERTVYDLEFVARDGHAVRVEVSSWLVREDGRPAGFQAICRDVSERKEAEQALRGVEETLVERENILRARVREHRDRDGHRLARRARDQREPRLRRPPRLRRRRAAGRRPRRHQPSRRQACRGRRHPASPLRPG